MAIFALFVRLTIAVFMPREIRWPDGREYEAVALSLVEHGQYGTQTLRPPGYPTLIAGVYSLFGRDLIALRIVESAMSAATVALIGMVGAGMFGPTAGLLAAALAALHPVLSFLPSTLYSENTLLAALVPAFGLTLVAARSGAGWRWLAAGACFGAAALIRPNSVLLLPGLGAGLLPKLRRTRRSLVGGALLLAAGLVLVVGPWIVRSHAVHGRWFFVATGGGRQFWFGNNAAATGATNSSTMPDSAMMAVLMRLPDEAERERYLYARGMEFVRQHPVQAGRLYLVKLGNLFALWPETYSRTEFVNPWTRVAQGIASAVIFTGALIAVVWRRRDPMVWPLVGAVASFALANAVFFTVLRYRIAFEPCLLWLAGAGWATVLARLSATSGAPTSFAATRGISL